MSAVSEQRRSKKGSLLLFDYINRRETEGSNTWIWTENKTRFPFYFSHMRFRLQLTYNATIFTIFILGIATSPRCLWFQELNYSATFVDVVLQVNAAELCSSWNSSSSLTTKRRSPPSSATCCKVSFAHKPRCSHTRTHTQADTNKEGYTTKFVFSIMPGHANYSVWITDRCYCSHWTLALFNKSYAADVHNKYLANQKSKLSGNSWICSYSIWGRETAEQAEADRRVMICLPVSLFLLRSSE